LWATSCTDPGDDDDDAGPPTAHSAFVVTSDYSDTVLARVDLDSGAAHDNLAAFPAGDMVLSIIDEALYLLSRSSEDVLRRYPGGDLSAAPDLEVNTGAGSNPQRLAACGGHLWVPLYNRSELAVLDPSDGSLLQTIDLHLWDEGADGSCEPATIVTIGSSLYVALQRFDLQSLTADPVGRILEVDCEQRTVTAEWDTERNPLVRDDPYLPGSLLITEGDFYALDGQVRSLDPATGLFTEALLSEDQVGGDFGAIAAVGPHLVASSWQFAATPPSSSLTCLNRDTGVITDGPAGLSQSLWRLVAAPDGTVWAGLAPSAAEPTAEHGIMVIDPATCEEVEGAGYSFVLPPTDFAFLETAGAAASN
jgi:hypothetical protein